MSTQFHNLVAETSKSADELAQLKKLSEDRKPVTFFALQCDIQETANVVKPDFEMFRFAPCKTGARPLELESKANGLLSATVHPVTIGAALPVFVPRETTDYLSTPAKQTTCELLSAAVRSGTDLLESDKGGASEHVEGYCSRSIMYASSNQPQTMTCLPMIKRGCLCQLQ